MFEALRVDALAALGDAPIDKCDFLIIGGGPAGLTVARALAEAGRRTLVLESGGLEESVEAEALNEMVCDDAIWSPDQVDKRKRFHAPQMAMWSHDRQGYGLRCRALGGSTVAWAGKSAAFSDWDFAPRAWVPDSGWPVSAADLKPYLDKAAETLNLGPNCYDSRLWSQLSRPQPHPHPDPAVLGSFFWQFARSSINPIDVYRAGAEFLKAAPKGCRVLTGATVLELLTDESGARAVGAVVADAAGRRRRVEARTIVLAASAIENPRILLNSRSRHADGLGNERGIVGRYLLDHPSARVASFPPEAIAPMAWLYGFYGLKGPKGVHMFMHGLTPSAEVQAAQGLLNCAAYTMGDRAPDDPWSAVKRIATRESQNLLYDAQAILKAPATIAKGMARLAFQSPWFPRAWSRFAVNQVLRFRPDMAVEEYLTRGVPHKLVGLSFEAICEQAPDRNNRIHLSDKLILLACPCRRRIGV
ncbi:MAG: FAD-dependent oxidoreductase [Burkholderiaceae bacterium]